MVRVYEGMKKNLNIFFLVCEHYFPVWDKARAVKKAEASVRAKNVEHPRVLTDIKRIHNEHNEDPS